MRILCIIVIKWTVGYYVGVFTLVLGLFAKPYHHIDTAHLDEKTWRYSLNEQH